MFNCESISEFSLLWPWWTGTIGVAFVWIHHWFYKPNTKSVKELKYVKARDILEHLNQMVFNRITFRVDCNMKSWICLCSLMSLFSYQEICMINLIFLEMTVFLESEFHSAFNCPLLYLSVSFLKGNTPAVTGVWHCDGLEGGEPMDWGWAGWRMVMGLGNGSYLFATRCLQLWHPARLWNKAQ